MKGLSVRQPWAWMIAANIKPIETRTWYTAYRGEILIVSSKRPAVLESHRRQLTAITTLNGRTYTEHFATGSALCIVRLMDCRPMTRGDERFAWCAMYPGAFSWVVQFMHRIDVPFEVKGSLGLFVLDDGVLQKVRSA